MHETPIKPHGNGSLRLWLAIVPILSLALSFVGSYGGRKYAEGEQAMKNAEFDRRSLANAEGINKANERCVGKDLYLQFLEQYKTDSRRIEDEISEARRVRAQK